MSESPTPFDARDGLLPELVYPVPASFRKPLVVLSIDPEFVEQIILSQGQTIRFQAIFGICKRTLAVLDSLAMKVIKPALFISLILIIGMSVSASGPVGVFAVVEKVILEPDDKKPQRIQIWGAFEVWQDGSRTSYSKPEKGYLYYKIPSSPSSKIPSSTVEAATLAIWADVKKVAGTGELVGFGDDGKGPSGQTPGRVRKLTEKPTAPDVFPLGNSFVKVGSAQPTVLADLRAVLQTK